MKIYLLYEFLSEPGGLERLMINNANFLREQGHDVEILTCHFDKKILELLPFGDIKINSVSKFNTKFEFLNLALCFLGFNNMKKYNPDLFISYSFPCNYLIRNKQAKKINYMNHFPHFLYFTQKEKSKWASSTQGIKRWASVILSWFLGNYLKKLDYKLVHKNDLIFTNSIFTKKIIDPIYGIDSIVNYPPLDKEFHPVKSDIKEKFIFSSGRVIPVKKFDWLIESLKYCKNKIPLYISGAIEESYKKELLEFAEKNNVEVKFLGRLSTEKLIEYYSAAQLFAFPIPKFDFGLVVGESLACGTPVVVWGDEGGQTEMVIDKVNGYLAKPHELEDFAKKIDMIIDSKMKTKNHAKILNSAKKFSVSTVKKEFVKEVNKVIKK
ncbi:MAG: glycosyltransferase family 4 protein [Candidatus Pacearchaeota archaeon]|jgi:glycosyltransferase involved in cell wall biosynthesis